MRTSSQPVTRGPLRRPAAALAALGLAALLAGLALATLAPPAGAQDGGANRFVVGVIGDSFAAGEGNPERNGVHFANGTEVEPEFWGPHPDSQRCHRSRLAFGPRAVDRLRTEFPEIDFEVIHVACSGAGIDVGLLGPYEGVEPDPSRPPMPAQLTQLDQALEALGEDRIDALVIGIAVNDIGFGDLVAACLAIPVVGCHEVRGVVDGVEQGLDQLPARFARLRDAVAGRFGARSPLEEPPGGVYVIDYPDPVRDDAATLCHRRPPGDMLDRITREETNWVSTDVVPRLNQRIGEAVAAANADGRSWTFVSGNFDAYKQHGFCAGARFMNTNSDALVKQGADSVNAGPIRVSNGIVHPNVSGHDNTRERVADAIATQIRQQAGAPALSVTYARPGGSRGRLPRIGLRWSVPNRPERGRFELEIRSQDGRQVLEVRRIHPSRRTFEHVTTGVGDAFAYRIRSCDRPVGPAVCTPFSNSVRGSSFPAGLIGAPTNLRRLAASGLAASRTLSVGWTRADARWSRYELHYRRVPRADDNPSRPPTRAQERTLISFERSRSPEAELLRSTDLRDITHPLLDLPPFSVLPAATERVTLGSVQTPLDRDDAYELRVRACSDVGCGPFSDTIVEQVQEPPERVGDLGLSRNQRIVRPGNVPFDLMATLNRGVGDPSRVELRLVDESGEVGRVTLEPRRRRLSLTGPTSARPPAGRRTADSSGRRGARRRKGAVRRRTRKDSGRLGARETLRTPLMSLSARRTRYVRRGRTMRVRLPVRIDRALGGRQLTVESRATAGRRTQPWSVVGSLVVKR